MLSLDDLSAWLYAISTGYPERAVNGLTSADLPDDLRSDLREIVLAGGAPDRIVERIGDRLHDSQIDPALVNECYRAAFYLSSAWAESIDNPLFAYVMANRAGGVIDKWMHYLPIYHRHLGPYRGKPVKVLEIGVYRAGGLRMLQHYLGSQATVIGLDVDQLAVDAAGEDFEVVLGDQGSAQVLESLNHQYGPFDIIIDDGGHTMEQQITTIETLFPLLSDGGIFIVEDCHTSYWAEYGGGLRNPGSFIEWAKQRIDDLHSTHSSAIDHYSVWATHVGGAHFYDSVVIFDKVRRRRPFCEISGSSMYLMADRVHEQLAQELIGTRDGAVAELREANRELAELKSAVESDPRVEAVGSVQDELRLARAEIRRLQSDTAELALRVTASDQERELMQGQLIEAWGQLNNMRNTVSWRVTWPLRFIRRGGL